MITFQRPSLVKRIEPIGGIRKVGQSGFTLLAVLDDQSVTLNHALTFDMPYSDLLYQTGFSSKSTLSDARNKCSQLGLFKYEAPPRGTSGGTYHLNPQFFPAPDKAFVEVVQKLNHFTGQFGYQLTGQLLEHFTGQFAEHPSPYIYINNILTDNRQTDRQTDGQTRASWSDIESAWTEVFGSPMKHNHREMVIQFLDEDGLEETLVMEAIERTKQSKDRTYNYLWRILMDWSNNEIKSFRDLIEHEKKRVLDMPKTPPKQRYWNEPGPVNLGDWEEQKRKNEELLKEMRRRQRNGA